MNLYEICHKRNNVCFFYRLQGFNDERTNERMNERTNEQNLICFFMMRKIIIEMLFFLI